MSQHRSCLVFPPSRPHGGRTRLCLCELGSLRVESYQKGEHVAPATHALDAGLHDGVPPPPSVAPHASVEFERIGVFVAQLRRVQVVVEVIDSQPSVGDEVPGASPLGVIDLLNDVEQWRASSRPPGARPPSADQRRRVRLE